VHVARSDHAPSGCNADLGFLEIFGLEADGVEHGAAGGAFRSVDHNGGEGTAGWLAISLRWTR